MNCDFVFDWVGGSRFFVRNGETALTLNIYTGIFEFSDMAFTLHFLRTDDLFVDVGANSGSFTILASYVCGASCISFEPAPSTFERLLGNISLNNVSKKVKALNYGLGKEACVVQFTSQCGAMNHVLAPGEMAEVPTSVNVAPLDSLLESGDNPVLIKIDVEGYEFEVIQGAKTVLQNPSLKAVILELNGSGLRYGYSESNIVDLMCEGGFNAYDYDPFSRQLSRLDPQHLKSGNVLFLRDFAFVKERIEGSKAYPILECMV
jgi:FkbM family methyltransferase